MEQTDEEMRHKNALDETRHAERADQTEAASQGAPSKKPLVDISSDAPIIFAACLAALKDLLDYGIGSWPGIGTVITFIFMIAIAMLLFLALPSSAFAGNMLMLLGGGGVEAFLFGLNFLPLLTATVLAIYIKTIIKRKSAGSPLGSIIGKALK